MKESEWKSLSRVWLFATPWAIQSMEFPGQNTRVGSCSLLQGIFPTQGLSPGIPHCRQILYRLSHQGSPRNVEWVAYPFSSISSWHRNWSRVSFFWSIAGRFFTIKKKKSKHTTTEKWQIKQREQEKKTGIKEWEGSQKTINKMAIVISYLSSVGLSVNEIKSSIKRPGVTKWIKSKIKGLPWWYGG